jgi:hypothetical protein
MRRQWSTSTSIDGKVGDCDQPRRNEVWDGPEDDLLADEFAGTDAVLARSSKILHGADVPARTPRLDERTDLIYDLYWDEGARLAEWQGVLAETDHMPVVLRAALRLEAWSEIEVL